MKPYLLYRTIFPLSLSLALFGSAVSAQTLTYDLEENPGWFAADAWGETPPTYDQAWVDGRVARFVNGDNSGATVNFSGNATVANFDLVGFGGLLNLTSATGPYVLQFSDTLNFKAVWGVAPGSNISIQGDFTMAAGWIRASWSHAGAAYSGTATLEGGIFHFSQTVQGGAGSNFVVNGGVLRVFQNDLSIGAVELNSGRVEVGRTASGSAAASLTVSELSGTGGVITRSDNTVDTNARGFTVNQSVNTSWGGDIEGLNGTVPLQFAKDGTGNLNLDGSIHLVTETAINGGGLFINGNTTSFSSSSGETAIAVNNGLLGGTGTITTASDHDIVLGTDGGLAAGLLGSAGLTTMVLGGGALDLTDATAGANTGWLRFDLGADATAGVSYDQIVLSSGVLHIGAGLDFNAFDFNLLAGFAPGTYVLFDTNEAIAGSLGSATGVLDGYDAELFIVGSDLVLQVIPEPASMAVVFAALVGAVAMLRRRRM